ncbi:hypothetical protein BO85DRAFT_450355 [Aspergillus piperis CBS 112811]|uniref:Uncharacterized protein n=1 Tax=Aspergillus piperis CBS 112811 TaxID=1448313 RepID=A0A8G1VL31_9EURO|nr:hypothetical protein BO85DRAFT_450355 [Aspergillus piperis CBS 112811]RAH56315.1 hypothetical protein BO85DRAFT_450355 [Aspergillus piperis CBS 112811]
MGLPPPTEPTPPYEETESTSRHNHTYSTLTQAIDDPEIQLPSFHKHDHGDGPTTSLIPGATPQEHSHCEVCERIINRRERRQAHADCCRIVAMVFVVMFVCMMILGIVIAKAASKRK